VSKARHLGGNAVQLASKVRRTEVGDLRRLKELEDENRRLKKIVADQALNIASTIACEPKSLAQTESTLSFEGTRREQPSSRAEVWRPYARSS